MANRLRMVLLSGVSLFTITERLIMVSPKIPKKWKFVHMPLSVQYAIEPNSKIRKMIKHAMENDEYVQTI